MDAQVTPIDPLLTIHKSAMISISLHFVNGRYRTARSGEWVGMVNFDRTGPTEKRGPPRKVDRFFQGNFSGWTEPIHSVSAKISGSFGGMERALSVLLCLDSHIAKTNKQRRLAGNNCAVVSRSEYI